MNFDENPLAPALIESPIKFKKESGFSGHRCLTPPCTIKKERYDRARVSGSQTYAYRICELDNIMTKTAADCRINFRIKCTRAAFVGCNSRCLMLEDVGKPGDFVGRCIIRSTSFGDPPPAVSGEDKDDSSSIK